MVTTYDWESSETITEGFTLTGTGDLNHAMVETNEHRGTDAIYTWEVSDFERFSVIESINNYTVAEMSRNKYDTDYNTDNLGRTMEYFDDTYNTARFRGEIK